MEGSSPCSNDSIEVAELPPCNFGATATWHYPNPDQENNNAGCTAIMNKERHIDLTVKSATDEKNFALTSTLIT